MKKIIAVCYLLILLPCCLFSQRQTDGRSRNLIRFGNTTISILNNFITDSGRKVHPDFIQYPFLEEVLVVTGSKLTISVLHMDSTTHFLGGINGSLIDTMQADNKLFSLSNLQFRINRSNKEKIPWKEVVSCPYSNLDKTVAVMKNNYLNYILLDDTIQMNETLFVDVRSRQKPDAIFRMRFTRTALPVMPFLAMMMHDSSSNTSETDFIKRGIETGNEEFRSINSFYKDWPSKYGKGSNNPQYFRSSKLAFYFRKYSDTYPDSSLEYSFVTDDDKDTLWRSSGHLVLITKLKANKRYTLLVRYKEAPENIWESRFYVLPEWYQTSLFHAATGFLTGLILVFIIFFIVSREKLMRERNKREKLQLEQRAIRSQLNPHFTFNALSSIQSLMNQNRISEANDYFTEFGSLLRNSLHKGEKEMLPMKEELVTLEQYIKLEQLRFRFTYEIAVSNEINISTVDVPSLLLQPLVENAVKHGISSLQEKGNIIICVTKEKKDMKIIIKDNGVGFNSQQETNGYGLSLTKERIHLLNQSLKDQKIQINIDSHKSGTEIVLSFINWL